MNGLRLYQIIRGEKQMNRFTKIYISEKMEKDYDDCCNLANEGIDKDCNTCSCNCDGKYWLHYGI